MNFPKLDNCRICGEVFIGSGSPRLCEKCRRKLEEIHARARRKLRETRMQGHLSSLDLAEALGEDPVFIQILVEEGLLQRGERDPFPDGLERARLAAEFHEELRRLKGMGEKSQDSGEGMFFNRRRQKKIED